MNTKKPPSKTQYLRALKSHIRKMNSEYLRKSRQGHKDLPLLREISRAKKELEDAHQ